MSKNTQKNVQPIGVPNLNNSANTDAKENKTTKPLFQKEQQSDQQENHLSQQQPSPAEQQVESYPVMEETQQEIASGVEKSTIPPMPDIEPRLQTSERQKCTSADIPETVHNESLVIRDTVNQLLLATAQNVGLKRLDEETVLKICKEGVSIGRLIHSYFVKEGVM